MQCVLIETSSGNILQSADLAELTPLLAPQKNCQWYELIDVKPTYNELTQFLAPSGYTLNGRQATATYTVTDYAPSVLRERMITLVSEAVQPRLDAFARERGYDSMISLCTYATSSNPRFAGEGQRGVDLRDQTWGAGYQILADVEAGLRPFPTVEQVVSELPVLVW